MRYILGSVLAMVLALASAAMAEGTGASITTGLPTDREARIMVAQIDNEPVARPQLGIGSADIVYEVELYNGGYTRYTAVFNDVIPGRIGVIRSARIVNADLWAEYNGVFIHNGGQQYDGSNVYEYMDSLNLGARCDGSEANGEGDGQFYRDPAMLAPNNLVCLLSNLYEKTDWSAVKCTSPLKFNASFVVPEGDEAQSFSIDYRGTYNPSYAWDAGARRYRRYYNGEPFVDGLTGEQVMVDNVIVQYVDYSWYANASDRPEVATVGGNRCDYFMGGRHFTGAWRRDGIDGNTVYLDATGGEVRLNPGTTYIQILKSEKTWEAGSR